ncbi:MAG TPA: RtcB family protein, partial [Methylomirabilota bacterium]
MRVPGLVVADDQLIESIRSDASLDQIANGATVPGIVKAAMAMPDLHQGYGLPVGGVVATDAADGVVSPGAIGFDINCDVRLLATTLRADAIADRLETLVDALYAAIPRGVGSRGELALDAPSLERVLERGATWAVHAGYGDAEDLERIESAGSLDGAVPDHVS